MNESDRERWRGRVDADIRNTKDDVSILFGFKTTMEREHNDLKIEVARMGVKVAIFSAIGAILGSAIVQFLLHR